jgi:SHAQKYF class myb-like DNA-binding protein
MSGFGHQKLESSGSNALTLATNRAEAAPTENLIPPLETGHAIPSTNPLTGEKPTSIVSAAAVAAPSKGSKSKKKKSSLTSGIGSSSQCGSQGENTGRWTAEEHRLFLQGLELHGKGWKKIASLIKSRTVVQIRTHAQKYFQKLAKARQNGEEGDITMEGRGCAASLASSASNALLNSNKRRRQVTGTKRKAIQTVVSSAIRQGRKLAAAQAAIGVPNPLPPLPSISPLLAPFFAPNSSANTSSECVTYTAQQIEDALYVFFAADF